MIRYASSKDAQSVGIRHVTDRTILWCCGVVCVRLHTCRRQAPSKLSVLEVLARVLESRHIHPSALLQYLHAPDDRST